MDMHLWLAKNRITVSEMARRLGVTRQYLSDIKLGKLQPGKKLQQRILEETNGEITPRMMAINKKPR